MKIPIIILLNLTVIFFATAQTTCPFVNAGQNVNLPCDVSCTNLSSSFLNVRSTITYSVTTIPYNPQPYTTGIPILINVDDLWSRSINLPFSFCFFGNSYNRVVVGSNGIITFNQNVAGGGCGWSLGNAGPIPTTSLQCNSIMGPYHDIDPTNQGNIFFRTVGIAPCRMFVVSWNNIPYYGDPNSVNQCCCQSQNFATQQIILHETTNIIDINIRRKNFCSGWNGGLAIEGIQNNNGTVAFAVAGRNNTQWAAQNDAKRFTPNGNSIVSISWYQGNNLIGNGATINVCPLITTNYTVKATYTSCGSNSPLILTDNVVVARTGQPNASFTANNACSGAPVFFQNNSSISSGSISFNSWDFGDGATDTLSNPTHIYTSAGTFNVTLQVTGSNGCTDSVQQQVTVFELPVADFSSSSACVNSTISFTDQTLVSSGTITGWNWNFGDGSASMNQNPLHSYSTQGAYNVQLIATSSEGCKDTTYQTMNAWALPIASFSSTNACFQDSTFFQNTSIVNPGNIVNNHWDYGNGIQQITNGNASYVYSNPGVYLVKLIVTSDSGCIDSVIHSARVYHLPVADFTSSEPEGCSPLQVIFTDQSTSTDGYIVQWEWDNGNQQKYFDSIPAILYKESGLFDVTLKVTTDSGCVNMLQKKEYVWVHPSPKAGFAANPERTIIFTPYVAIEDKSFGASSWSYAFGDKTFSLSESPEHTYSAPGIYKVEQVVMTSYGCTDSTSKNIEIDSAVAFYIPSAFSPNNDGKNEYFTVTGIGIKQYEFQIFDRWGTLIFSGSNQPWNGKQGDKVICPGVYAYQFVITDIFNNLHIKKGTVSVIN